MTSTIDLDTLLASLPACKRCRKNRRRCDTKLPSCANCSKAGVECIFYDHALQEELPRSYIASLVEHLTRDEDTMAVVDTPVNASIAAVVPSLSADNAQASHLFAYAQGAYRYLGAGSHLLDISIDDAKVNPPNQQSFWPALPPSPLIVTEPIPRDLQAYLTQVFFDTIHQVYPFLSSTNMSLNTRTSSSTQEFIQEMVCAIACHCERSGDSPNTVSIGERKRRLRTLGAAAHSRALRHIEQATASQAVSTLQVVVLLVLYTLVCPSTGGNISQQLGFAIRLVIDLCESGSDSEGDDDGERERLPTLSLLYKVIYCLENHVCGVLIRPTALPELVEPLVMPTFSEFQANLAQHSVDNRSLDLLCTLYRVQARIRNHGQIESNGPDSALRNSVLAFGEEHHENEKQHQSQAGEEYPKRLHPNVAAALNETCLLLEPTSTIAAVRLIDANTEPDYLATFISPYWVHRAAVIVTGALTDGKVPERLERLQLVRAYGQAVALLTSWASSWDAAGVLRRDLEQRLSE